MTNQMVSRFRVKKLSVKQAMPIFKESQLPDLGEAQRSIGDIETGVEKDEEVEHDLQAAISAAQAAVTTGEKLQRYIPTPDASRHIPKEEYDVVYKKPFKQPSNLIKFSMTVEDMISCQYFMDEADCDFLNKYNKDRSPPITEDEFEDIMHQIESTVNTQLPHLSLDPTQTPQPMDLLEMLPESFRSSSRFEMGPILEHWRSRRLKRDGKSIIPSLQYEDILKNEIDPYVCFRRRETKPVRKTRRTDQQSLERLRKLRMEMEKARGLLEMVLRREKIRKESLVQEHAVFEKRCEIREYQRLLGIKDEEALMPATKKKRKTAIDTGSSTTIKIPLSRLRRDAAENTDRHDKTPAQLAMEAELAKKREADAPYEDVTDCPYQPFPLELPMQFFQTLHSPNTINDVAATAAAPRFRKRIGRGGRVFIDRVGYRAPSLSRDQYQFDPDYEEMEDVEMLDEMDDRFLRHRAQLLSVDQLRNFVDLPSLLQGTRTTHQRQGPLPTAITNGSAANVASQSKNADSGVSIGANAGVGASPVKRQNSRQRMTPQQASVAMANGMIAANLSAHVNGTLSSRAPLRQQPQQQRAVPLSNNGSPLQQPTPPPQKPSSSPSPQLSPQRSDLTQQQQHQQQQPQRFTTTTHVS